MSYRKIGGIRFLRIGRFQLSGCRLRPRWTVTAYHIAGHSFAVRVPA